MDDGDNLAGLINDLESKADAIQREMRAARQEIAQANRNIEDIRRAQARMTQELGAIRQQLSQLHADQQALRIDLSNRLDAVEKDLAANTDTLRMQQAQLAALVALQKEEVARRRLEQEKGRFVVRLSGLLDARRKRRFLMSRSLTV